MGGGSKAEKKGHGFSNSIFGWPCFYVCEPDRTKKDEVFFLLQLIDSKLPLQIHMLPTHGTYWDIPLGI